MAHSELNIEALFEEYLVKRCKFAVDVSASDVARPERLARDLQSSLAHVSKETIAAELFNALQYAYDKKYGDWDAVNDLRALYPGRWHVALAPYTANIPDGARILAVGANDGREIVQLVKNEKVALDVLDISAKAMSRARKRLAGYARTRFFVSTFEKCELAEGNYDMFFSLRTLNSTAIDVPACVKRSIELTREDGILIYSVSNGYIQRVGEDLIPVKGMFSYRNNTIDVERPKEITQTIVGLLKAHGADVLDCIDDVSEIFIIARKKRNEEIIA